MFRFCSYGVILEKLQERGEHLLGRIKGCVVDSAPVPDPDPQVQRFFLTNESCLVEA